MPVFDVSGSNVCPICECEVRVNCMPSVKPGLGACDECGLPFSFSPAEPSDCAVLESVSVVLDEADIDWEVIESYYEATGEMAVTIGCVECDESVSDAFDEWANDAFDMYWGMSVEEAKEAGWKQDE